MRQQSTPRPGYRRSARFAALPSALLALGALPAVAAQDVEPGLRMSRTLTLPSAHFPSEERMLLRVEYQAAQSRASEADLVGDILMRVRRINGMIGDINRMVSTSPGSGLAPPIPAPTPPVVPTPPQAATHPAAATAAAAGPAGSADIGNDAQGAGAAGSGVALRALMASVIVFLFWLLGKRHNYIKAQRRKVGVPAAASASEAAAPIHAIPASDALVAMPPPAAATASEAHLAQPTHAKRQTTPVPQEAATAAVPAAKPRDQAVAAAVPADAPAATATIEFELVTPPAAPAPIGEPAPRDFDAHADQALELAEIMVSMGLAQGAADALTERIRNNPRRALFHWLKLLEVYRQAQRKDDFERAAQELRQAFNVQPAGWVAGPGSISIEDFPHLVDRLRQLWPTPACTQFLNDLLEDNRGGTRSGLPQSVAEEILLLERILNAEAAADLA